MKLVLIGVVYVLLGFIGHLSKEPLVGHMSRDWQDLSTKGLGIVWCYPLAMYLYRELQDDIQTDEIRFSISYLFTFVIFGIGVLAGYRYFPSPDEVPT